MANPKKKRDEVGRFAYEGIERLFHEKARLSIMTSLVTHPRGLPFTDLKELCSLTDGNLSRHLQLLQEAGLVEVAKGYLAHERQTLEAVISARNAAVSGLKAAAANPGDPAAVQQLAGAENALTGALGRLFALAEAYPDLKANTTMMQLSEELTTTENKVAFARQAYNDSVMGYNNKREVFPGSIVANMFAFQPAQLLEIESPAKREVPQVKFT